MLSFTMILILFIKYGFQNFVHFISNTLKKKKDDIPLLN
jgi:hypothetical protein